MRYEDLTTPVKLAIEEHVKRSVPFSECIFRPGSQAFREFYRQVREMHKQGLLELDWEDQELIETDIGECIKLNGEIIPLDVPFLEFTEPMARQAAKDAETGARAMVQFHNRMDAKMANTPSIANTQQYKDYKKGNQQRKIAAMKQGMPYGRQDGPGTGANAMPGGALKPIAGISIPEAEYQGRKVKLNSPKRGGSKKFYVYVKNPKTGRVKKISWGDTSGLSIKTRDRGAVASFVARHKCKQANDKMTARYWSCRTPRYKSLGVKGGQWW